MQTEEKLYRSVPKELAYISKIVRLMDSSIKIPGTNRTIGLDPIIGLVPVLGELVDFLVSAGIMLALVRNGASGRVVAKMLMNVGIDVLLMMVPVLGNVIDFVFKANQRNLKLAVEHFEEGKHQGSAWPIVLPVVGALLVMMVAMLAVSIWLFITIGQWVVGLF